MEIVISGIVSFILGMFFEAWTEPKKKRKAKKRKKNTFRLGYTELYCFECEIVTPTKEKDGKLYCTNCSLIH